MSTEGASPFERLKAQTKAPPSNLSGPTSLAHFIGGDRSVSNANNRLGLRKPNQDQDPELAKLETDTGPVRTFLSGGQIALPGMASKSYSTSSTPREPTPQSNPNEERPVKTASVPVPDKGSASKLSPGQNSLPAGSDNEDVSLNRTPSPQATVSSPTGEVQKGGSPSQWQTTENVGLPKKQPTLGTPRQRVQDQNADDHNEQATASLNRLRSSNIVKERLGNWGQTDDENGQQESPSKSSPRHSPSSPVKETSKRASVLDRWGRDEPDRANSGASTGSKTPFSQKPLHTATMVAEPQQIHSSEPTSPAEEAVSPSMKSRFGAADIPLPKVWPPPNRVTKVSPVQSPSADEQPSQSPKAWMREPQNMVFPMPSQVSPREKSPVSSESAPAPSPGDAGKQALSHPTKDRAKGPKRAARSGASTPSVTSKSEPVTTKPSSASHSPSSIVSVPAAKVETIRYDMKEIPLGLPSLTTPSKSGSTLSVEVYSIQQDGSSTLLSDAEEGTFFDTELLAVIHRHKLGAVAATDLFLWHGKQAQVDRKASEEANALARRYRADITEIHQGDLQEACLANIFNNRMITRMGMRAGSDGTDSKLYCVQQMQLGPAQSDSKATFIDEVHFSIESVNTGFSYVAGASGATVVWHGRSSSEDEQNAAVRFATSLARKSSQRPVVEYEAVTDGSKLLHMLRAETAPESSVLWRWKTEALKQPRIYTVDPSEKAKVSLATTVPEQAISVVDIDLEVYLVVPPGKRDDRTAIRFALDVAEAIGQSQKGPRPVHSLIFPTLIPSNLKACFRGSAPFQVLNEGVIPSKMNVLSVAESREQLGQTEFSLEEVSDPRCLPLGLAVCP